jgi:hypothetical protein
MSWQHELLLCTACCIHTLAKRLVCADHIHVPPDFTGSAGYKSQKLTVYWKCSLKVAGSCHSARFCSDCGSCPSLSTSPGVIRSLLCSLTDVSCAQQLATMSG